jgi:outer membrane protein assembly factor BamB
MMSKQSNVPLLAACVGLVWMTWADATPNLVEAAQPRGGGYVSRTYPPTAVEQQARQILSRVGVDRGICVLLDEEPAGLAVAMARQSELTIYLQLPSDEAVGKARRRIDAAGLLGTRIYVEKGDASRIHLADNLADAVVVTPAASEVAKACGTELWRVVRPLGKLLLADRERTKPYPEGADDWAHPYKGPDNNPQSSDRLARAPYLTQFLAEPWYVPFPEVTVTSAGRVFKAFGHVGYKRRDWPWLNTLIAINGYNGTLLWKRSLEEGFNIHRNCMIATPQILYSADSKSCKLLDAASGELRGEIAAPEGATGPVWKWMAMEDGVLCALVGEGEFRDKTLRGTRTEAGWPWTPMTAGYDAPEYPWGFGRTFFAVDLKTKKVLWTHVEKDPIDGRAVALKAGRIYYYAPPRFLACLDAKQGKPLWHNSDPKLLEAIGPTLHAQRPDWGFSSSAYLKCSDKAIYFAGPQRTRLVAASTDDGHLLWQYPHGNFQLVLRGGGRVCADAIPPTAQDLYAMGRTGPSKLFDPLSGRILADLTAQRGNCTRATGTIDSIFTRGYGHGGTTRLVVADNGAPSGSQRIALMRPDCHDGVIVGSGLLYWGPWMCDCNLSLVGIICLGPAGDFDFQAEATDAERLESFQPVDTPIQPLAVGPGDWPAYRADNRRTAASEVDLPTDIARVWEYRPPSGQGSAAAKGASGPCPVDPAAPVTAGGLVFASGSDGVLRAIDAASGKLRWQAYTGGPITYPPAVEQGRLLVGSGDGWVYAFEAASGRPLWRFRVAPAERKINLYGKLASTWPVASGVLVDGGIVYAAAGIASYDGTHVYALDASTGRIRWQNNTSGQLAGKDKVTGVSVQGHMLLYQDRLYLAGGNVVSPAVYDVADGRCLNTLEDEWAKAPRGCDLFILGGKVVAFERLLYAPKEYWPGRYFARHLLQADSGRVLVRAGDGRVVRIAPAPAAHPAEEKNPKALWQANLFQRAVAMALGKNAVVVAGQLPEQGASEPQYAVVSLAVDNGRKLWQQPLPAEATSWGLALDSAGRIVVALEGGRLLCFAAKQ